MLYSFISFLAGTYNRCKLRIHVINKVVLNLGSQKANFKAEPKGDQVEEGTDRLAIKADIQPGEITKDF